MPTPKRTPTRLTPWLRPVGIGVCVGAVCVTLFLLLFALLLYQLSIPLSAVTPMAMAALGLGGFTGGLVAGLCSRQNGLAVGAVCGTLLTLILLIVSLARGDGLSPGLTALKWAVLTVCSAAGGVLGVNRYHR